MTKKPKRKKSKRGRRKKSIEPLLDAGWTKFTNGEKPEEKK